MIERSNAIKQLRVLNLAIRLASISEWCFDFVESCGFLEEATYLEQADLDPLHCLNSLSLIEKLAETPLGVDYLSESGTLDKIQNLLKKEQTLYPFFLSEMIRVLSLLSTKKTQQEWWDRGHFLEIFEHFLECGDIEFQEAAINAVARLGETEAGLHQIVCHPQLLKNFVKFLQSSTPILCNSCLHSLAVIFRTCPEDETPLQQIYSELPKGNAASSPISFLLPYANNQSEEAHNAFFDLIRSLSFHSWSAEKLLQSPGFFEWLISRPNSITKQDAEWKYEIVSVLLETLPKATAEKILGPEKFRELKRYFNQGVFYVPCSAARNALQDAQPRMETAPS